MLNGSKNYPLKEPFVNLIKSSMNTFLNAMTYPDRTCYPVASTNKQDLYNLSKVYLDAVFKPILDKKVFQQEGWHYELDANQKQLNIKGVVYNEMKGVYSNPDSIFYEKIFNNLHPDITYQYESGGDPKEIPKLSYEEYLAFHKKFYHPSNSYIFYYGNDKSSYRFELINSYLCQYDYQPSTISNSLISKQPIWKQPKTLQYEFDPGSLDNKVAKSQTAVSWLLPKINPYTLIILEEILLGNPSSVLYKALMESGYGDNLSIGSGLELDMIQPIFSIGMQGVLSDNIAKLHNFIPKTLKQISTKGFEPKDVQAAVNSIEFNLKEFNSTSQPVGLSLILSILSKWIYDEDYIKYIKYQNQLDSIKTQYKRNPQLFSNLIQELFLLNSHNITVTSIPKTDLDKKHAKTFQNNLNKSLKEFNSATIKDITKAQEELEKFRQKEDHPNDLAKLPTLSLQDLSKNAKDYPYTISTLSNVNYQLTNYQTNKILYTRFCFDLNSIHQDELQYLPLLINTFKYLDTQNFSNQQLNQELNIHTGNFNTTLFLGGIIRIKI
ncbi:hypothetical protein HC766_03255 [Candidatus Gracilibacteria bacterium]|nr:hypothetical protein [Candidatus Gracilibacteria bacterium]